MILIISKNLYEPSTEATIDWIDSFKRSFRRINGDDLYVKGGLSIEIQNRSSSFIEKAGQKLDTHFESIWYRRWSDYMEFDIFKGINISKNIYDSLMNVLRKEENAIKYYFFSTLRTNKWLSHPNELGVNKLHVLEKAAECGLTIPSTYVISNKKELERIVLFHKKLITKPIEYGISFVEDDKWHATYTEKITIKEVQKFAHKFLPSLFQQMIEKKYEIRAFFIKGHIYSMCIFSQLDAKTSIDFRKYNEKKPNRRVPFILPSIIEDKIKLLISKLDLTSGSIDIIKGVDNEYYFLEVNPVGQFGMVSYPCNYYLEKKIAEYLITPI